MSDGFGIEGPAKHAVRIDPHQGGDKEAMRGGANMGIVDHHEVDRIDHKKHHNRVMDALEGDNHYNVCYYDGGEMRK